MLSDATHQSVVDALQYPVEKRFHRFLPIESDGFIFPADRRNRGVRGKPDDELVLNYQADV